MLYFAASRTNRPFCGFRSRGTVLPDERGGESPVVSRLERHGLRRLTQREVGVARQECLDLFAVFLRLVRARRIDERAAQRDMRRRRVEDLRLKPHELGELRLAPVPPRIGPPPEDPRVGARRIDENLGEGRGEKEEGRRKREEVRRENFLVKEEGRRGKEEVRMLFISCHAFQLLDRSRK